MSELLGIARFKFHEGKREEYLRLSEQAMEIGHETRGGGGLKGDRGSVDAHAAVVPFARAVKPDHSWHPTHPVAVARRRRPPELSEHPHVAAGGQHPPVGVPDLRVAVHAERDAADVGLVGDLRRAHLERRRRPEPARGPTLFLSTVKSCEYLFAANGRADGTSNTS